MHQERKVVLITGASRGIGATLVRGFAQNGYSVVINYHRSEASAIALYESIVSRHGSDAAIVVRADVASRADVKQMFDQAYARFGRVDVLINNAGINRDKPFIEMTDEDWSCVIDTILTGTFICSQEYAFRYTGSDGHIVNIGALTAIRGRKNGANYCSARAGVVNLTKCLAKELAPRIRVNCVTPGWIDTDELIERYELSKQENLDRAISAIPLARLGTPDDIFRTINFIVNESSYTTGQNFLVDGGTLMH